MTSANGVQLHTHLGRNVAVFHAPSFRGRLELSMHDEDRQHDVVLFFFDGMFALDFDAQPDPEPIAALFRERVAAFPRELWVIRRTTHGAHALLVSAGAWPDADSLAPLRNLVDEGHLEQTLHGKGARLRLTPKSGEDTLVSSEYCRISGVRAQPDKTKEKQLDMLDAAIVRFTHVIYPRYVHLAVAGPARFSGLAWELLENTACFLDGKECESNRVLFRSQLEEHVAAMGQIARLRAMDQWFDQKNLNKDTEEKLLALERLAQERGEATKAARSREEILRLAGAAGPREEQARFLAPLIRAWKLPHERAAFDEHMHIPEELLDPFVDCLSQETNKDDGLFRRVYGDWRDRGCIWLDAGIELLVRRARHVYANGEKQCVDRMWTHARYVHNIMAMVPAEREGVLKTLRTEQEIFCLRASVKALDLATYIFDLPPHLEEMQRRSRDPLGAWIQHFSDMHPNDGHLQEAVGPLFAHIWKGLLPDNPRETMEIFVAFTETIRAPLTDETVCARSACLYWLGRAHEIDEHRVESAAPHVHTWMRLDRAVDAGGHVDEMADAWSAYQKCRLNWRKNGKNWRHTPTVRNKHHVAHKEIYNKGCENECKYRVVRRVQGVCARWAVAGEADPRALRVMRHVSTWSIRDGAEDAFAITAFYLKHLGDDGNERLRFRMLMFHALQARHIFKYEEAMDAYDRALRLYRGSKEVAEEHARLNKGISLNPSHIVLGEEVAENFHLGAARAACASLLRCDRGSPERKRMKK